MNWLQNGTTEKKSTLKENLSHADYEWRSALVKICVLFFVCVSHSLGNVISGATTVSSTVKLRFAVHE